MQTAKGRRVALCAGIAAVVVVVAAGIALVGPIEREYWLWRIQDCPDRDVAAQAVWSPDMFAGSKRSLMVMKAQGSFRLGIPHCFLCSMYFTSRRAHGTGGVCGNGTRLTEPALRRILEPWRP
jgi:hypothetical protein